MADARPIIIKKKVSHGGHHGGAWKVAYADFVTAMMALFIVLWLLNSSKQIQEAVGGYFKDPTGTSKMVGSGLVGSGENFTLSKDNMEQLKEELQKEMKKAASFDKLKNQIEMTITAEGLRIELMESDVGTFFLSGNSAPTSSGQEILVMLAHELGKLPNNVSIEGHTDSKPFASTVGYTNWELSADRANSARRLMQANGVRPDQVSQVRGYADRRLRDPKDPEKASNRRISMIVQYLSKPADEKAEAPKEHGEAAGGHGGEAAAGHAAQAAKEAVQQATGHGSAEPAKEAPKAAAPAAAHH